jgi:outer membrane lipoprotein-sorting protein
MKPIRLTLAILFLTCLAAAQQIKSGESLVRAMHDRYASTWYKTVTFTQKSTTYKPDGTTSIETWYEAVLLPGKLRIDIGPAADGNGYVFSDGNVTIVKANKVFGSRPLVNMLLVLGFDVYTQPADATIKMVKGEGYDLSKFREDMWEGKPAYVVGADKGDLKSKQFWVAKDSLLFLREIEPSPADAAKVEDIRFVHYQPLANAWIAAGVEMYVDDKKVFSEDYTDIQANVSLAPAMYDPAQFAATHWEK